MFLFISILSSIQYSLKLMEHWHKMGKCIRSQTQRKGCRILESIKINGEIGMKWVNVFVPSPNTMKKDALTSELAFTLLRNVSKNMNICCVILKHCKGIIYLLPTQNFPKIFPKISYPLIHTRACAYQG